MNMLDQVIRAPRAVIDDAVRPAAIGVADGVIRDVAQFRGTLRPNDDMTLLIVRRLC